MAITGQRRQKRPNIPFRLCHHIGDQLLLLITEPGAFKFDGQGCGAIHGQTRRFLWLMFA